MNGWAEFVSRVTWRPNAHLSVIPPQASFATDHLRVRLDVEDTYRPDHTVTVLHAYSLPPWEIISDDTQAAGIIRHMLHRVDMHETDEWLRVDGEIQFDPHAAKETP